MQNPKKQIAMKTTFDDIGNAVSTAVKVSYLTCEGRKTTMQGKT
jgi:hypothetical protein